MSIPRKPMLSTISKPFNFTRRFLLASLLLIVLAAALVSYVASDFARRSTLDHNQEKATLIANSLMQQLYRRLIEPRQGAVRSPQAILPSLREIPELDAFVRSQLEGLDVAKLNIIDLNGRVLYSTDPSAVGQDVSKTAGYSAALAGTPWTGLEYGGKVRGLDGVERTADFANVYVPITRQS